ncbi:MAG TPA: CobD/CbiB family protein [Casimicrobiaceae bacterium]|nr:CobD/CbiB family protein [Casimicrobiaceae bacterium]
MSFLALLAALGLEQWRAFAWRAEVEHAFVRFARGIERRWNGGTSQHGWFALAAAIVGPVVAVEVVFLAAWLVHPALAVAWNIVVLYFMMGFRRFSHAVSTIINALTANDLAGARRALALWRGGGGTSELSSDDVARLAIERGMVDAYRQVFAVIFWFVILPGPAGALIYRAVALLAEEWGGVAPGVEPTPLAQAREAFGRPARQVLAIMDWIPVRLTALSFAIVGDFEDAVACWRTQAQRWAEHHGGPAIGILLASGGGALGVQLGGPLPVLVGEPDVRPELGTGEPSGPELLPSAVGLVWRALILWLLVILLVTVANVVP